MHSIEVQIFFDQVPLQLWCLTGCQVTLHHLFIAITELFADIFKHPFSVVSQSSCQSSLSWVLGSTRLRKALCFSWCFGVQAQYARLINIADEFPVSVFKDSTTASTSTQRLIRSLKAPNKPSLDTPFSNTWLLEEKNGKNKINSQMLCQSTNCVQESQDTLWECVHDNG